jgi:hypothetical protein
LRFPLTVNEPLSVVVRNVQDALFTERSKLLVPSEPLELTVRFVPNVKSSAETPFDVSPRFAFQGPLILVLAVVAEFDPQPERARLAVSMRTAAITFIRNSSRRKNPGLAEMSRDSGRQLAIWERWRKPLWRGQAEAASKIRKAALKRRSTQNQSFSATYGVP